MPVVRVHKRGQVTIPTRLRLRAGLEDGDLVDASLHHGKIILTPQVLNDHNKFPTTDGDYTPEQRRILDARLAESAQDLRQGRTYGPFESADATIKFLRKEIRARKRNRDKKRQG